MQTISSYDTIPTLFEPARLLKLADVLEQFEQEKKQLKFPVNKFDLVQWGTIALNVPTNTKPICGTSACALGTASLHPWFRKKGFVAGYASSMTIQQKASPQGIMRNLIVEYKLPKHISDADRYVFGYEAASYFFGISANNALYLFDPEEYPKSKRTSATYVAKRIRTFVTALKEKRPIPEDKV